VKKTTHALNIFISKCLFINISVFLFRIFFVVGLFNIKKIYLNILDASIDQKFSDYIENLYSKVKQKLI